MHKSLCENEKQILHSGILYQFGNDMMAHKLINVKFVQYLTVWIIVDESPSQNIRMEPNGLASAWQYEGSCTFISMSIF